MDIIPGFTLINFTVILTSYFLILLVNKETRSKSAMLLVAILTFHHLVAYLYAFHLSFPENEVDPAKFLRKAEKCIDRDLCGYLGYHLYVNYLAKMLVLGGSLYFVFLINILFYVISIYFFIGIADLLSLSGNRKTYLFLYSMWPSVIYFTTLHYREPFELYLLIIGIYLGLSAGKENSFIRLLGSMIFLFIMGLFHIKGLLFLSPVIFLIVTSYKMPLKVAAITQRLLLVLIMGAGSYFSYSMYTPDIKPVSSTAKEASVVGFISDKLSIILEDKAASKPQAEKKDSLNVVKGGAAPVPEISFIDKMINKIMRYRSILLSQREVRTAFLTRINDENMMTFIVTFSVVYLEYLFAPFIFQVTTLNQFVAYAESVLRFILFMSSLILLKRVPQSRTLFLVFLAITSMWTIGVVSYGASIRHHIQTNWILVLLGVPAISQYITNILNERKRANAKVKA